MKQATGNLVMLAHEGKFDIIVHGCNCFHTMGSGIAAQLVNEWPQVRHADKQTQYGSVDKLGTISVARALVHPSGSVNPKSLYIVNAYTQYGIAAYLGDVVVDLHALEKAFHEVRRLVEILHQASWKRIRIGYPKIGAGLAGGEWKLIAPLIEQHLEGLDHTVVIYDNV